MILIATAIGGGVMFAINNLGKNISIIDTSDLNNANRPKGVEETDTSPINLLIMGSDSRSGEGNTGYGYVAGQRSDTTLLIHIYEGRKSATIISIPRDSYVKLPVCKNSKGVNVGPETTKFNAAFAYGGPVCTIKTIESLTNVRVDKFVVVDFNAFKKIVDAIGGVQICLTKAASDPIRAGSGGTDLNLPAGYSTLNGDQALQFVRARENLGDGSDLSRINRQQAFIGAMMRDMSNKGVLGNPGMVYQILSAITQSLSTSQEWASVNTLQEFALSLANLKPSGVTMLTTPNKIIENGNVAWTEDATAMWAAIAADQPWPPVAVATPTPTPTPTVTATPLPAPSTVSVAVANGTTTNGKAASVATALKALSFNVTGTSTSTTKVDKTEIRYAKANELQAKSLAAAIGYGVLVADETVKTGVKLVVGKDWTAASASASASASATPTPTPTPTPSVSTDATFASDTACIDPS